MNGATVTKRGLEIDLFGWHVWTIARDRLIGARVASNFNFFELFGRQYQTLRLGSRPSVRYVIVEKLGWPQYVTLTPADPDAFVEAFQAMLESS